MRTLALLLFVALLASAAAYLRWRHLLGPTPFTPPAPASPTFREQNGYDPTPAALELFARRLPAPLRIDTTFERAIHDVCNAVGADVFVNWRAIEQATPVRRDTPVATDVDGMLLADALSALLAEADGGHGKLGRGFEGGVIMIGLKSDFRAVVTQVYDIRDLIDFPTDLSDGPFYMTPEEAAEHIRRWDEQAKIRRRRNDEIIRHITASVDPGSWRDAGGSVGAIRELSGQLIVTQTTENQRAVTALLERRRWRNNWYRFGFKAATLVVPSVAGVGLLRVVLAWRRRARRRRLGLCLQCGYDLRASAGQCPECGDAATRIDSPSLQGVPA